MVEFSFGQVEATLAAINDIADHKRVAFAGRLKFLLKNGLLARERQRPGRGKAGTFTFPQVLQLALAVELLRFGLTPQRSAQIVDRSWGGLSYTAYTSILTDNEWTELCRQNKVKSFDRTDWMWLVQSDAMSELVTTRDGYRGNDDTIIVEMLEFIDDLLSTGSDCENPSERRTMLINGTALVQAVFRQIAEFRFATTDALRDDLRDERFDTDVGDVTSLRNAGVDDVGS